MVAELAVKAEAAYVVTHNARDFAALAERFDVEVVTPGASLRLTSAPDAPRP